MIVEQLVGIVLSFILGLAVGSVVWFIYEGKNK